MSGKEKVTPEPSSTAIGYKAKAEWMREVTRDTGLSPRAKLVGHVAAWELAGAKGHFRSTRKRLADICGVSDSSVKRAVAELAAQKYWHIETTPGANRYTLICPSERLTLWTTAESAYRREWESWLYAEHTYRRECESWLQAEKKFHDRQYAKKWLDAEYAAKENYTVQVFSACHNRGAGFERSRQIAEAAWTTHQSMGMPLKVAISEIGSLPDGTLIGSDPQGAVSDPPMGQAWPTDGSTLTHQWVSTNVPTRGNDDSHKYFKSDKDEEVIQVPAARALDDARCADSQGQQPLPTAPVLDGGGPITCQLCGPNGQFLDIDGYPVVVLDDEAIRELPVTCQHSLAGNLAEIHRIENANPGWGVGRTGRPEIDCHYPYLADRCD